MHKKLIAVFSVLVLVTLACSLTPTNNGGNGGNNGGNTNGGNTQPTAQSSNVLFSDDFSNSGSGWDQTTDSDGSTDYYNGSYRIQVQTTNLSMWANPSKSFPSDVRIEVDATKNGGPDDNAFGIICRYQDTNNFYRFYISSDGYAGVLKVANGDSNVISSTDGQLHQVDGINQGAATNHIRADCVGSNLTLYANGKQVASATDSEFTGGDVGLIARTYDTGGVDILFDNFVVSKP